MGLLDNSDDTSNAQPSTPSPNLLVSSPLGAFYGGSVPQDTIDALNRQRAIQGLLGFFAAAGRAGQASRLPIPTGAALANGVAGQLEATRDFDQMASRGLLLGPQYQALNLENRTRALNNALLGLNVQGWQNVVGNGIPPGKGVAPSLLAPPATAPQTAAPTSAQAGPSTSPQVQPFVDAAKNAETANNLPPGSVSGFLTAENSAPGSVSSKGAAGPFQLMPDTAKAHNVTDPNDPAQSSAAAAAEAAQHYQRYAGDPAMVAAAYNWGSGNLDNWLSNGADPAKMPAETKRYIGNYVQAQSPEVQRRALSYLSPEAGQRLASSIATPPTSAALLAPDNRLLGGPTSSSGATPLLDPVSLIRRAQQFAAFPQGVPIANQYLQMAQHMMPQGTMLMSDGSVALPPGADVAEMTKALAAKGFVRGSDGFFHIDPGYVAGSAALAGAEANAKVPAQQAVERSKFVPLSRPGEQLYDPLSGRIIAQNPVLLKGVDPATGTPFEEYRLLGGPGATGAAPAGGGSDLLGGSYVLPSGRTVPQAAASVAGNPPSAAPPGSAPPAITTNEQGFPRVQTDLSPLAKTSAEARGKSLEELGSQIETNADNAVQNNALLDQMRGESKTWQMGKFADFKNDALAYLQGFGKTFNLDTSGIDQRVGDFQAFNKNGMELVRQAVRSTSSRAAVQEFTMIQQALPNAEMSEQGFGQIADQLQSFNDFHIAKQQAAQAWRQGHNGTLDGFNSDWNAKISPSAFLMHRLAATNPEALNTVVSRMSQSSEGVAYLKRLQGELKYGKQAGIFGE